MFEALHNLRTVTIDFKENYIGDPNTYIMSAINQRLISNNPNLVYYDFSLAFNDLKLRGSKVAL